uniref:Gem-associated protein 2 n=1 Tax=Sinocyclocheilus rhinocerous TaxID=307959 RepID=A0A673N0M7_9TELE
MKSDVEELMPRLLPVESCDTEEYNSNEPPRNPQEYLRQVQREASLCPDVVVAQIDPKKLKMKQSVNVSITGCLAAPQGFSPCLKWQQQQVSKFSEVRQSVNKHRQHWKSQFLDDNVVMPKMEDEDGWKRFCLGENVCLDIQLKEEDKVNLTVLDYLINWFEERDFVPQLGRWLYALLACLEKPLLPEAHSLIRQLARRCSAVRANLESKDDDRLSALNLMICIVARYFEQNDLADKE